MSMAKVKDFMTLDIEMIDPEATLEQAAIAMKRVDCGILPVGSNGKIEGVITDRDIVVRALASEGEFKKSASVKSFMTCHAYACNENDSLEDAIEKMRDHKVGRLLVRDNHANVVGILSFGGLLRRQADPTEVSNIIKHTYSLSKIGHAL